jgi:hypothetical protein
MTGPARRRIAARMGVRDDETCCVCQNRRLERFARVHRRGVERAYRHDVEPERSVARGEQQRGDRFAIAIGKEFRKDCGGDRRPVHAAWHGKGRHRILNETHADYGTVRHGCYRRRRLSGKRTRSQVSPMRRR